MPDQECVRFDLGVNSGVAPSEARAVIESNASPGDETETAGGKYDLGHLAVSAHPDVVAVECLFGTVGIACHELLYVEESRAYQKSRMALDDIHRFGGADMGRFAPAGGGGPAAFPRP